MHEPPTRPLEHPAHRFYAELARWWPLISPVEDYAEEAEEAASMLERASRPVRTVLELGSGGGHNAFHLKRRFEMTLTDLSEDMLAVSRRINPECSHVVGDMRTLRLGRTFDAVFAHDAVDYLTTEAELALLAETAFEHCNPGGLALFVPDCTKDTFSPSTESGGSDGPNGEGVRYLEWTYDPDPSDDCVTTEYAFVLREADGTVRLVGETHVTGVHPESAWVRALEAQGFVPEVVLERTEDDREPRVMFIGHRPPAGSPVEALE